MDVVSLYPFVKCLSCVIFVALHCYWMFLMNRILARYVCRQACVNATARHSGFTLIELLVVIVIIALSAAIAAPSWVAFTNRQKVSKAADRMATAFQEARSEAKKNKQPYRLTFRNNAGTLEYSVQRADVLVSDTRANTRAWKPILTQQEGLRPGFLFACTNVTRTPMNTNIGNVTNPNALLGTCQVVEQSSGDADPGDALPTIVFSSTGGLPINSTPGIVFTVGLNRRANPTNANDLLRSSRRCVFIETLLGGTRTARDTACPTS